MRTSQLRVSPRRGHAPLYADVRPGSGRRGFARTPGAVLSHDPRKLGWGLRREAQAVRQGQLEACSIRRVAPPTGRGSP
jgi:hypothetical protein